MSEQSRAHSAGSTPPPEGPEQHGTPPGGTPPAPEPESTPPGGTPTAPERESTPPGGPAPAPAPAPDAEELTDRWRRALADLDNLRKRHARDRPRELEAERARVAAAWLPVLDHLELALSHAEADPATIVRGVEAVRDQAVEVLRGLGYPRHDETGVPFDPLRHEVVSVADASDPATAPGTVVQVVRPGYGEPGRQLRPAAVAVTRKPG
ncbi:nucleotide exchange factor GrpE [Streptomyces jumonjinensis]|uniref:Protein GrpE n=1 Tax=Streptomyces jumonjinensis TaxID=1945 RepID=A0A646KCQ3_STRJU|nr:nucleotide exchange factor GrpE [Streptomyces jumonjinensis]MQS98765.1 nucleotide exchange factor GrpE [Streptomyces jumonjinensis]